MCHLVQSPFQGDKGKYEGGHQHISSQHGLGLRLGCVPRPESSKMLAGVPCLPLISVCCWANPLRSQCPDPLCVKRGLCTFLHQSCLFSLQTPQREPASAAVFEELTGRKDLISFGLFWHRRNTVIKAVGNLFSVCTLFFFLNYTCTQASVFWIVPMNTTIILPGGYHPHLRSHVKIEINITQKVCLLFWKVLKQTRFALLIM